MGDSGVFFGEIFHLSFPCKPAWSFHHSPLEGESENQELKPADFPVGGEAVPLHAAERAAWLPDKGGFRTVYNEFRSAALESQPGRVFHRVSHHSPMTRSI